MYLNTPQRGGATTFPDVGLEVAPVQGQRGLLQLRPRRTRARARCTAARRCIDGEKWVATKWLREGVFE